MLIKRKLTCYVIWTNTPYITWNCFNILTRNEVGDILVLFVAAVFFFFAVSNTRLSKFMKNTILYINAEYTRSSFKQTTPAFN